MLLYFGMDSGRVDLTLIKGSPNSGLLVFSSTLKAGSVLTIYSSSVTGLFSKEEKIEI